MKPIFNVSLEGDLDGLTIGEYNESVVELINSIEEESILILDFKGVTYMNSTAIGHIADWYNNLEEKDSEVVIIGADEGIQDTLELVGLSDRIEQYDTIDDFKITFKNEN